MGDRPAHAAALALALLLGGCGRSEDDRVVLYVSADDYLARQVVRLFEQRSDLDVSMVGDTEQTKTTGLVNRLRAEKDNPQADVFWSSEIFHTILLAEEGVLEPYLSEATAGWPARFRDPEGRWYGFAARARVIAYAPGRVDPDDLPRTWMELTRPAFRGRLVMADPRFGTTGGHLAVMKDYWRRLAGPAYYEAFLMGLADNELRLLPGGNAAVVQAVADGEADLGPTDTDDVFAAQARGLEVAMVYPRHSVDEGAGGGTLLIPNTVARVAGGPHPAAAARLIDFLLSPEVARMLAESVSHNVPLREELAAEYPQHAVADPLAADYAQAAELMPGAVDEAMQWLATGARAGADADRGDAP